MPKKVGPYIGVTGFMSNVEVKSALEMIPLNSWHRLMVGVLMSSKTLAGLTNKWPGRYPRKEKVAEIFVDHSRALNLIHYNTDSPETLCDELVKITELAGPHLDGFQLNVRWPSTREIFKYALIHPDKFILLQIGSGAMEEIESMERFKDAVLGYWPMIDAILIDPSGGKGQPLDPWKGAEYLRAVHDYPMLGIGIAGGLGPQTLDIVEPLVEEFSELSIDAEGRLRTPQPEDALDLNAVRNYINKAYGLFESRCRS